MSEEYIDRTPDFVMRYPSHHYICGGQCHPSFDYQITVIHERLVLQIGVPRCNASPGLCVKELLFEVYGAGVVQNEYVTQLAPAYRTGIYNRYFWTHQLEAKQCLCCKQEAVVDHYGEAAGWTLANELFSSLFNASCYLYDFEHSVRQCVCSRQCIGNVAQLVAWIHDYYFSPTIRQSIGHASRQCTSCGEPVGAGDVLNSRDWVCLDCKAAAMAWAHDFGKAATYQKAELQCVRKTKRLLQKANAALRKNDLDALRLLKQEFAQAGNLPK